MAEDERERIQIRVSSEEHVAAKIRLAKEGLNWQQVLYPRFSEWLHGPEADQPRVNAKDASILNLCATILREKRGGPELLQALRAMIQAMAELPPQK